ncbi:hypothetical protein GZL_09066 [Streptomyces sp. 769]|nr:hypothetical protein GZL_09066 [Streptomyces sp. 769]
MIKVSRQPGRGEPSRAPTPVPGGVAWRGTPPDHLRGHRCRPESVEEVAGDQALPRPRSDMSRTAGPHRGQPIS